MTQRQWENYSITVNGLTQQVQYNKVTVEKLFVPLLQKLTVMRQNSSNRVVLFLAAPPATGKSTLTLFLEQLSKEREGLIPVQAVGLDGFHYHAEFIRTRSVMRDGIEIPMSEVKGCPETFDTVKLSAKLSAMRNERLLWPIYDRKIHDVVEDKQEIKGEIILLEGNWLLLRDEEWSSLRRYADYTLLIRAELELLKERLISRKMQGGFNRKEAVKFYEKSDSLNVERTLRDSIAPNEIWEMLADNDYQKVTEK